MKKMMKKIRRMILQRKINRTELAINEFSMAAAWAAFADEDWSRKIKKEIYLLEGRLASLKEEFEAL